MNQLIIACFSLLPFAGIAQSYKPFKVNVSAGYGLQPVSGANGGLLVGIEPRYSLNDRFEVGVRLEGTFPEQPIPATVFQNGDVNRFVSTGVVSSLVTANYWLSSGRLRPYVGIGVGPYWAGTSTYRASALDDGGTYVESINRSVSRFGGLVRAGVKTGHLTLSAEYNRLGSTTQQEPDYSQSAILGYLNGQPIYDNTTQALTWTTRNSYVGLKVGLDIGGGRR